MLVSEQGPCFTVTEEEEEKLEFGEGTTRHRTAPNWTEIGNRSRENSKYLDTGNAPLTVEQYDFGHN